MNWKSLRLVACAFVASLAVAGCSKEDARDVAGGEGVKDQGSEQITLDLNFDDLSSELGQEELRLLVEDRPLENGKHKGVSFLFNKDQGITFNLYFQQMRGNQVVARAVMNNVAGKIKEKGTNASNNPVWKAYPMQLNVSREVQNMLNSNDDVYVAGVFGSGSNLDVNGSVTLVSDKASNITVNKAGQGKADVGLTPMYLPLTKLEKSREANGQITAHLPQVGHFRFYGALVELKVQSKMHLPLEVKQVVMDTEAFSTSGVMKLSTTMGGKAPEWTATRVPNSVWGRLQKVAFSTGMMKSDEVKKSFLWVMPAKYSGRKKLQVWVRDENYSFPPEDGLDVVSKSWNVKQLDTKVYRIPVVEATPPQYDLIYTELYYVPSAGEFIWEIYNPTSRRVLLRDHYQNLVTWSGAPSNRKISIENSIELSDSRMSLVYSKRSSSMNDLYLDPGEMAIYVSKAAANKSTWVNAMKRGPKLAHIVSFDQRNIKAFGKDHNSVFVLTKGGVAQMGLGQTLNDANIIDSFLYFNDPSALRGINTVDYARRPDRNIGRKFWYKGDDGKESDWVYHSITIAQATRRDLGWRFGWYAANNNEGGIPVVNSNDRGFNYTHLNFGGISYGSYIVPSTWTYDIASTR